MCSFCLYFLPLGLLLCIFLCLSKNILLTCIHKSLNIISVYVKSTYIMNLQFSFHKLTHLYSHLPRFGNNILDTTCVSASHYSSAPQGWPLFSHLTGHLCLLLWFFVVLFFLIGVWFRLPSGSGLFPSLEHTSSIPLWLDIKVVCHFGFVFWLLQAVLLWASLNSCPHACMLAFLPW